MVQAKNEALVVKWYYIYLSIDDIWFARCLFTHLISSLYTAVFSQGEKTSPRMRMWLSIEIYIQPIANLNVGFTF